MLCNSVTFWRSSLIMAVRKLYGVIGAAAVAMAVAVPVTMEEEQTTLPWCRKGGVMVSVGDLWGQGGRHLANSGAGAGNTFLLWGGKGNDKVLRDSGGSPMLGDVWTATTSTDKALLGKAVVTTWSQVPLDPASSPDGRWKSGGDVFSGYFLSFGGGDVVDFMNDLWVLPLAQAVGAASPSDDVSDTSSGRAAEFPTVSTMVSGGGSLSNYQSPTSEFVAWGQPTLLAGSKLPQNRRGHTVTVLPASRTLVVVGGRQQYRLCLDDAWVLPLPEGDLTTPEGGTEGLGWNNSAWAEIPGVPGLCRWGHAATLITDPITKSEGVAIFGGRKYTGSGSVRSRCSRDGALKLLVLLCEISVFLFVFVCSCWQNITEADLSTLYEYNNELWLLSVGTLHGSEPPTATWALAATGPLGQRVPAKRDHQTMSFDPATSSIYVFGGRTSPDMLIANDVLNDLWKYNLASKAWTQVRASGTDAFFSRVRGWSDETTGERHAYLLVFPCVAWLPANLSDDAFGAVARAPLHARSCACVIRAGYFRRGARRQVRRLGRPQT